MNKFIDDPSEKWRIPSTDLPINTGLFTPDSPEEEAVPALPAKAEQVPPYSASSEEAEPTRVQPTTPDDLNDINPDPNALPTFPIRGLPEFLQSYIQDYTQAYSIPLEFIAASIIHAIGGAIGKGAYTLERYKNYPALWMILVAPSGIGKSDPMTAAYTPIQENDTESYTKWEVAVQEWQKKCQQQTKKQKQEPPPKPIYKQRLIADVTSEALFQTLHDNPDGLVLFRDELKGWFNELSRYTGTASLQHYLSLFDGRPVMINRKTSDPTHIPEPFLAILGSVQPPVLMEWLRDKSVRDNGFAPRVLFVWPDNMKKALSREDGVPDETKQKYAEFIQQIVYRTPEKTLGKIPITEDARAVLRAFEERTVNLQNGTEIDHLKAVYSKMMIHVNRLAIAIAVAWHILEYLPLEINGRVAKYAVQLAEYFIATGEKVYRLIAEGDNGQGLSNADLLKLLSKRYTIKSQTKLAEALGTTQQAISKLLK